MTSATKPSKPAAGRRDAAWVLPGPGILLRLVTNGVLVPRAGGRLLAAALALALGLVVLAPAGRAAPCTRDDFAAAVDAAGAALREFNATSVPKIQARLKELQTRRGWSDADLEEKAVQFMHDARIAELDATASALLERIDTLGEVAPGAVPDCAKLAELKKATADLIDVRRQRAAYSLARIEAALAGERASAPAAGEAASAKASPPGQTVQREAARPAPAPKTAQGGGTAAGSWSSTTRSTPSAGNEPPPVVATAPPASDAQAPTAGDPRGAASASFDDPNGYSIDEIRQATRGFFGTISTNLASVIEYAFSNYGRPTGYVLGQEGGGAFLAGLRYGKGELFMRSGESRKVYWHGPSVGYDFGAEGSRTLFLVYNLDSADGLFRRFGGVDGSAYLVGGVGLTVLKGGPVLMAPIRTGLGLRLGASIGYLRFTPNATWNPF